MNNKEDPPSRFEKWFTLGYYSLMIGMVICAMICLPITMISEVLVIGWTFKSIFGMNGWVICLILFSIAVTLILRKEKNKKIIKH